MYAYITISLVPRPPLFAFTIIHVFRSMYYCEDKVKMREAWEQGYIATVYSLVSRFSLH